MEMSLPLRRHPSLVSLALELGSRLRAALSHGPANPLGLPAARPEPHHSYAVFSGALSISRHKSSGRLP
jgi:hypothetical protein